MNERIRLEHAYADERASPRETERGTPEEPEREVVREDPREIESEIDEPKREQKSARSRFHWSMTLLSHSPEYGVAFA